MFRRLFWIFLALVAYSYFVATDGEGALFTTAKKAYSKYYKKLRRMGIEIKVNKLSSKKR